MSSTGSQETLEYVMGRIGDVYEKSLKFDTREA